MQPGKDAWGVEFEPGAIMEGDAEEHIIEVAGVLSRYCDLIGIRAFPPFRDWSVEREDRVIRALARHSSVPVINMETIVHPCQEMALMLTLKERVGSLQKDAAAQFSAEQGGSFQVTHDIEDAYSGADVVYAKSWGALPFYGRPEEEWELRKNYRHFIVDEEKMAMTNDSLFSHCLPLRRNVKATDGVMDADYCVAIDEAENRLHVQKAIMMRLLNVAPRRF